MFIWKWLAAAAHSEVVEHVREDIVVIAREAAVEAAKTYIQSQTGGAK